MNIRQQEFPGIRSVTVSILLAFGLAGCGGGSDTTEQPTLQPTVSQDDVTMVGAGDVVSQIVPTANLTELGAGYSPAGGETR